MHKTLRTIGVAVPVYNEERVIFQFLESIYKQSYPINNINLYIADNMSTDSTTALIQSFQKTHQGFQITIKRQPVHGIAPTRKCAMDIASVNSDLILTTDADCVLPGTLISESVSLVSNNKTVIGYNLEFPKQMKLILFVHYQRVMRIMKQLSEFQERLFGPVFFTGCLLIPSDLYKQVYWDDVLDPIIPEDDYLLCRRLSALGANFVRSNITVSTSDRRFRGNTKQWIEHNHEGDYRDNKAELTPPDAEAIQHAIYMRTQKAAKRILQSLIEYMFLASIPKSAYVNATPIINRAVSSLGLPPSIVKSISSQSKKEYYDLLNQTYFTHIFRQLSNQQ